MISLSIIHNGISHVPNKFRIAQGKIIDILPIELHQVFLYEVIDTIIIGLDYLPYRNKDLQVLLKLLAGVSQPGQRRLRIFRECSLDAVMITKDTWIFNDFHPSYDIILQKDEIQKELNSYNEADSKEITEVLNKIGRENRFEQINLYNQNCIHFVDFLTQSYTDSRNFDN